MTHSGKISYFLVAWIGGLCLVIRMERNRIVDSYSMWPQFGPPSTTQKDIINEIPIIGPFISYLE